MDPGEALVTRDPTEVVGNQDAAEHPMGDRGDRAPLTEAGTLADGERRGLGVAEVDHA
jgi:hypothetical protein